MLSMLKFVIDEGGDENMAKCQIITRRSIIDQLSNEQEASSIVSNHFLNKQNVW